MTWSCSVRGTCIEVTAGFGGVFTTIAESLRDSSELLLEIADGDFDVIDSGCLRRATSVVVVFLKISWRL